MVEEKQNEFVSHEHRIRHKEAIHATMKKSGEKNENNT